MTRGMILQPSLLLCDDAVVISSMSSASISNSLILLGAIGYYLYDQRPKGSVKDDLVDVKRSTFIKDGLGVVAKKFIAKDTVLGVYPGYCKPLSEILKSSKF